MLGLMHLNKNISEVNPTWTTTNVQRISICRWMDMNRYGSMDIDGYRWMHIDIDIDRDRDIEINIDMDMGMGMDTEPRTDRQRDRPTGGPTNTRIEIDR